MTPERRIIQFPHPGGEHVPKGDEMPWNAGQHRRKFLVSRGRTVDAKGRTQYEGPLTFWGEWEPPSTITKRWPREDQLPTVLHEPYWVDRPAVPNQQNTDPWVFGPHFLYCNCKQLTPHGRPSALQDLAPGSLALFGSTLGNQFVLDTVLVVEKALANFRPVDGIKTGTEAFQNCTIRSLAALEPKKRTANFTIYAGATPERPYDSMFSFTPALRATDSFQRFRRPSIRIPGIINALSRQSPRGLAVAVNSGQTREVWQEVVSQVSAHGLELGTHLQTPPRR